MKILKWVLITVGVLMLAGFLAFPYLKEQTKKTSPEVTTNFTNGDLSINVTYSRPSKKGREIFGALVPYGETWRTGANEATVFETNKTLIINGKELSAGKYTLWTVPNENSWDVIFNNGQYSWGISMLKGGKASREEAKDEIIVPVPVQKVEQTVEQFTIAFEEGETLLLVLTWDDTKVAVPFSVK
jgi:hypothetical protein